MVSPIPTPFRRLMRVLGIDRAVAYSLLIQGWTLLSQPVTVLMVVTFLSETERGYFYTFGSMIGVQTFLELGLGIVTLQFMSHEAAHLHWAADGTLAGDATAKARLASILRMSWTWYAIIGTVLFVALFPAGWVFFTTEGEPSVSWRLPWSWTVLVAAASALAVAPSMLMSASGRVADMVQFAGYQRVSTTLAQWLALYAGAALLSWPAAQTVGLLLLGGLIIRRGWPALSDLARQPAAGPRVHWRQEVWPMQWRIALGTPLVYLIAYTFTPVLFARDKIQGPIDAGKMGMSLSVMHVLISATIAWVGVRVPTFGHLIARRQWATLDKLFSRLLLISTTLSIAGAAAAFTIIVALQSRGYRLGTGFLPPLPLALLLANAVVQHMVNAMTSYLRAHKRDPYFPLFVAFGILMIVSAFTVGRAFGPVGLAAALLTLNTTICLGGGIFVFTRCRRAWHNPAGETAVAITADA